VSRKNSCLPNDNTCESYPAAMINYDSQRALWNEAGNNFSLESGCFAPFPAGVSNDNAIPNNYIR